MKKRKLVIGLVVLCALVLAACTNREPTPEDEIAAALVQLENDLANHFGEFGIDIFGNQDVDPIFAMHNHRTNERNELVMEYNATAQELIDRTHELTYGLDDWEEIARIVGEWEERWAEKFAAFDAETEEIIERLENQ